MLLWWTVNHWIFLSPVATAIATFLIWRTNRRYTRATELIQRPRVEVFTELCQKKDPDTVFESRIRIANLSPVGIWLDKGELNFSRPNPKMPAPNAPLEIKRVLGPFSEIEVVCHEHLIQAYPGQPDAADVRSGVLRFKLIYRVHNDWVSTSVRDYDVLFTTWELKAFKAIAAADEYT